MLLLTALGLSLRGHRPRSKGKNGRIFQVFVTVKKSSVICGLQLRLLGLALPVEGFELVGGVLGDVLDEVVLLPATLVALGHLKKEFL